MSKPKGLRARIARRLRCWADRIDNPGAPKAMSVRFTFEDRVGIVFRDDGRGCPLWYYGDEDYERAHDEAGPVLGANSTAWLPQRRPGRTPAASPSPTGTVITLTAVHAARAVPHVPGSDPSCAVLHRLRLPLSPSPEVSREALKVPGAVRALMAEGVPELVALAKVEHMISRGLGGDPDG